MATNNSSEMSFKRRAQALFFVLLITSGFTTFWYGSFVIQCECGTSLPNSHLYTTVLTTITTTAANPPPPQHLTMSYRHGRAFDVSGNVTQSLLRYLDTVSEEHEPSSKPDLSDLVIVTGSSENHYRESLGLVASVQRCLVNTSIIYYNLGLTAQQEEELRNTCQVQLRNADFSNYPVDVSFLEELRFKPVLILEALQAHELIFWVDSSVRFSCGQFGGERSESEVRFHNFMNTSLSMVSQTGVVLFSRTSHSNFAVTHPNMLQFFPTEHKILQTTFQWQAGLSLMWRTRRFMRYVLRWYVLCALELQCMHPKPQSGVAQLKSEWHHCTFHSMEGYAKCHRQDQAILNILLLNEYKDMRLVTLRQNHLNANVSSLVLVRTAQNVTTLKCGR